MTKPLCPGGMWGFLTSNISKPFHWAFEYFFKYQLTYMTGSNYMVFSMI